jgi:hypothetical protein
LLAERLGDIEGDTYALGDDGVMRSTYRVPAVGRTKFQTGDALTMNILPGTYSAPPPPFEDGTPIPRPLLEAVDATAAAEAVELAWRAGDVAMIDNTRWLHGRRGFTDRRRRVLSVTAYADFG